MKPLNRYDSSGLVEDQFEQGSRGRVLRNKLGVRRKREMDGIEAFEYDRVLDELLGVYDKDYRFTSSDIIQMHELWLERVYEWAGRYRQVNLSKDGFPFATAKHIPVLMKSFEEDVLRKHTSCCFNSTDKVIEALAIVHTELVLIHPFREGNGRIARMLAILMALQAGLPMLDFGGIKGKKRKDYFLAVQAGLGKDYEPMKKIFISIIRRTLRIYGRR
jgi:cell filamentation protein